MTSPAVAPVPALHQLRVLVGDVKRAPLLHKGEAAERVLDAAEQYLAQLEERVSRLERIAGIVAA